MKRVLTIEGMTCEHCVNRVKNALENVAGVKSVKVRLKKNTATLKLKKPIDNETLRAVVEDAGYDVVAID
ncbi:MAG: heavy-metal-associated domain-containing protein [Clostridiales bacterium]|nr:heavy-metal-associated domain-containing protein [Clostridiales bacterium]